MWGEGAASISFTCCLLLATRLRFMLFYSSYNKSNTSSSKGVWLVEKADMNSNRTVLYSSIRRITASMARQMVLGDKLVRCAIRLDLEKVGNIKC